MAFVKNVVIQGVDRIHRRGIGYVYKGRINIADLADALNSGYLKYAPKYQRGQKQSDENDFNSDTLLDITNEKLAIQRPRAEAMAAKYLMGDIKTFMREMYNPDIVWNARLEEGKQQLEYDEKKRQLTVHSTITIPDSAHRHFASYLTDRWKKDPENIPDEIIVADDGEVVDAAELRGVLKTFDPKDDERSSVFVTIFNIPADHEGRLFDEYNVEGKKPSNAAAIDMYSDKTASRRFVDALMKKCPVFERTEVEMRSNTIAPASRKITTVATLDQAIKPYQKRLLELEKDKPAHSDLVAFFSEFYSEWAKHFPEFQPTASGKARQLLRNNSFAMSNIMFFPMFRMAIELWEKYRKADTDWQKEQEWRDGIARIAGKIMTRDHTDENGKKVSGNPDWQGKILIQQFDTSGQPNGWSLSSTRQTRDAAYHYLVKTAKIALPAKGK